MCYVNKREKLEPLTEIEKEIAEKYHDYVYTFCRVHHYPIEECYDIVIIGFLKGVQTYCRRADLQERCVVTTICDYKMKTAMSNHFRAMNTLKRKPIGGTVSLDAEYRKDNSIEGKHTFENCIVTNSFEDDLIEDVTMAEILNSLSERQKQIAILKTNGYTHNEICLQLHIGKTAVSEEVKNIKIALSERCGF